MHHRIRPWHAAPSLLLLSLSTVAVAQAEPTLAQLTELVTEAHRTAAATTIVSFRADLRIEELARTAEEHRGQVELEVRFLDWKHPDTGRSYPLIRYRQTDSSRSIAKVNPTFGISETVDSTSFSLYPAIPIIVEKS